MTLRELLRKVLDIRDLPKEQPPAKLAEGSSLGRPWISGAFLSEGRQRRVLRTAHNEPMTASEPKNEPMTAS